MTYKKRDFPSFYKVREWEMDIYLLIVTLLAIAIVILGVSWWKWHAFISLTVASLF